MTKSYSKICKCCGSQHTKKDWTRKWRQSYKCNNCNHVRVSQSRKKCIVDKNKMYEDFSLHKQTYQELSTTYWVSIKTVQSYLDSACNQWWRAAAPTEIILLIDTTYFGSMWLMLFKDKDSKDILHYEIVAYETNEAYKKWVQLLQGQWWSIKAIVCDWRRWLLWWFNWIPTQMCHFHQEQIIRRYITKKPVLEANKELKEISNRIHRTDKQTLERELERWYTKHEKFLKEQGVTSTWRKYYIHRRTRSAYFSLKRNLKYLFVYQDYYWILDIPNTTNWIEAVFSHLKYKVNLHRGLREDRKLKLILHLIHSRLK